MNRGNLSREMETKRESNGNSLAEKCNKWKCNWMDFNWYWEQIGDGRRKGKLTWREILKKSSIRRV